VTDKDWLRGDWMQTYTGKQFYALDPRPEDIDPHDIAHALSMQCRFNGHVTQFYSVAEHCILLSEAVSPENALWALLHDATEAYVGDLVRPLKKNLPQYIAIEDKLMGVIAQRFGIEGGEIPPEVHWADARILLTERDALMRPSNIEWAADALDPLPVQIQGWNPGTAEVLYLARLWELTDK
jgi:hypothetical protein